MKIPGANPARQVQSLGRQDPRGPMRVANTAAAAARTEGAALRTMGDALEGIGNYIKDHADKKARHDAALEYQRATSELNVRTASRGMNGMTDVSTLPDSVRNSLAPEELEIAAADPTGGVSTTPVQQVPAWRTSVQAYDADHEAIGRASSSNLSPLAAKYFQERWALTHAPGREKLMLQSINEARNYYKVQTVQMARTAMQEGDVQGAEAIMRDHVRGGLFSPAEGAQKMRELYIEREIGIVRRAQMDAIEAEESGDPERIEQAQVQLRSVLEHLGSEDYVGVLPMNDRLKLMKNAEARIESGERAIDEANAVAFGKRATQLSIDVDAGRAGPGDIDHAFEQGWITQGKHEELHRRRVKNARKKAATTALVKQGSAWGASDFPPDPTDKKNQKVADALLASRGGSLEEGLRIANEHGILPSETESVIRRGALSDNPQAQQAAAQAYQQVLRMGRPHLLKKFSTEDRSRLDTILVDRRNGVNPQQTAEKLLRLAGIPQPERESMMKRFDTEKDDEGNTNAEWLKGAVQTGDFEGAFDVVGIGAPERLPQRFYDDFMTLARDHYVLNGGYREQARRSAMNQLIATWGGSSVNGDSAEDVTIMQMPPERTFNITSDQIDADLEQRAVEWGVDRDSIVIQSDRSTVRDPTSGYVVYVKTEFAGLKQLRQRWVPDRTAKARAQREERVQEAVESAAEDRSDAQLTEQMEGLETRGALVTTPGLRVPSD